MGLNAPALGASRKKITGVASGLVSAVGNADGTITLTYTDGSVIVTKPIKGEQGEKGEPFTYDDFTEEQLEALKGKDGVDGKTVQVLESEDEEIDEAAVLIFDPNEVVSQNNYTKPQADARFAKSYDVGDVSKLAVSTWKDLVTAVNYVYGAGMGSYKFEVDETKKQLTIVTRSGVEIPIDISQIILNTNIEEFKDMLVTNILDGQSLVWSASKKKWVNKSIDSSGMLVEAKAYTDEEIKKFNNKGSLAVDEKPTYYGGIITYKQGGVTKTTDNAGTWFYYFDENDKAVQTIFIEGTEFTIAMAGDINLDDYVAKTDVVSDFVENPLDKSKIPNLEYMATLREVLVGALGSKVNTEDVVDDLGFENDGATSYTIVPDSKIPNVKALKGLHTLLFEKFMQLKNIIKKNDTETASSDKTVYSSAKVDDLLREDAEKADFDLSEFKMLGWNVPTECPIQNEVVDNQFIQKVNRVDLGTLTWQFSDGVAYTTISTIKPQTNKLYLNGYTVYNSTVSISSMVDKTIKTSKNSGDYTFYIKDSAITSVSDAKSKLSGKYLFYELNTPIVKNIDDSDIETKSDAESSYAKQLIIDARAYANISSAWSFIYSKVNKKGCYFINLVLSGGIPIIMLLSTESGTAGVGMYSNWNGEVHGFRFQGESLTAF